MKAPQVSVKQFRPDNWQAIFSLILPFALLTSGLFLSLTGRSSLTWFSGQVLLGIFFFQCFILLHETGHLSFFKSAVWNKVWGHFFGFICFIPFTSWTGIHNLHHRWTGWRDKDPTTEATLSPNFGWLNRWLVNLAWALFLPLFTIAYRLGNYWSPAKLKKHLPAKKLRPIYRNQLILVALYGITFYFFGNFILHYVLVGYLISLVISDLFILSQHSHIETPVAGSRDVKPLKYPEQIPYTRSLGLNRLLAKLFFLNFNLHELHHAFPGVPAYHLSRIEMPTPNYMPFLKYLITAKRMSGMKFIFSTSPKATEGAKSYQKAESVN